VTFYKGFFFIYIIASLVKDNNIIYYLIIIFKIEKDADAWEVSHILHGS
jgi:hypothetical protein